MLLILQGIISIVVYCIIIKNLCFGDIICVSVSHFHTMVVNNGLTIHRKKYMGYRLYM